MHPHYILTLETSASSKVGKIGLAPHFGMLRNHWWCRFSLNEL